MSSENIKVSESSIEQIKQILTNKDLPMPPRFRSIFTLKNIGGKKAIDALVEGLSDTSALLKHEIAYVLGQMGDHYAIPILKEVLKNDRENPMVRHEAGEALGAIGDDNNIPFLESFLSDPFVEVAETCQIAIDRIKFFKSLKEKSNGSGMFYSVDPAPPYDKEFAEKMSHQDLENIYLSNSLPLFERYRALFTLRDRNDSQSLKIICKGLKDKSALFRHEVAFVLGQLQNGMDTIIESLQQVLNQNDENPMVRHEAAEALGAIATEATVPILDQFLHDNEAVVKESCEVALDIHHYFSTDEFQYANALVNVSNDK